MRTYALGRHTLVVLALTMVAWPALAQSPTEQAPKPSTASGVEVTPFVSLGSIASSRIGAAIRFRWTPTLSLEAETGYRRGEIGALSAHMSLLYDLPRVGRLRPYLAGGLGIEQYGTALDVPRLGLVTQARLAFAVNAGGGLEVPVNQHWGMRTDARWFNGLGTFAPEHWRLFNGVTIRPGRR
jgi:hypothetical protein